MLSNYVVNIYFDVETVLFLIGCLITHIEISSQCPFLEINRFI